MKYVLKNEKGEYLVYFERTTHTGTKRKYNFVKNLQDATVNPIIPHKLFRNLNLKALEVYIEAVILGSR